MRDLAGLEELTGLNSLTLNLSSSQVRDLAALGKLTGLTSLTLDLSESQVQNLAGLDKLMGLTSLTLDAGFSRVQNLEGLGRIARLKTLELSVPASMAIEQNDMKDMRPLTKLMIFVSRGENLRIPEGCKFVRVMFVY